MSKPTAEQIAKLPKWAQEHVLDLERQRREAVRALADFTEHNATGPVRCRVLVCDGESQGPTHREVRFEAHWVEIEHAGVTLGIALCPEEIRLSYSQVGRASGCVYLQPTSFQQFKLKSKMEH